MPHAARIWEHKCEHLWAGAVCSLGSRPSAEHPFWSRYHLMGSTDPWFCKPVPHLQRAKISWGALQGFASLCGWVTGRALGYVAHLRSLASCSPGCQLQRSLVHHPTSKREMNWPLSLR